MPVSFNHLRISRSMSRRHGLPPAPPSLPHQVVRDTLSPCVAGTPPCCRGSVPIAHFLLKTSSSRTNLTRSSSTNTCFNGPLLWDSEDTRRTALPLRLAEEPVYSGAPTSPRSEMHRLPFGGGRSISGTSYYREKTDPTEICDWCQWEGGVEPEQSGRSSRRSYRSEYSSGSQINNKRLTRLLQVVVFLQQQTRVKPAYLRPPWLAVLNP
ncbi:hypothetical protein Bca52824_082550 [Brassica carinata]|uniref:Uncharacterized protein n=1 Tax=Brassica carinata TaxID=52824 RepID=A0A8X7PMS8_BRACI|nr:hypothetical protein Bca52824_082550 [Brassica carinata]